MACAQYTKELSQDDTKDEQKELISTAVVAAAAVEIQPTYIRHTAQLDGRRHPLPRFPFSCGDSA
jgi:hypothetical protein